MQFEPWVQGNRLGPKTWVAKVASTGSTVILKLWDAWKFDASIRDNELATYLQLRPLWGKIVPSLLVSTPIEFFHGLVLEYVQVHIHSVCILIKNLGLSDFIADLNN